MKNKELELLLYIQVVETDGKIEFTVPGMDYLRQEDDQHVFGRRAPLGENSHVMIDLKSNLGQQSHLLIKKITWGGVTLNHINQWINYRSLDGRMMEPSYGWLSVPGKIKLKIRQNPLIHNYMLYFYSVSDIR